MNKRISITFVHMILVMCAADMPGTWKDHLDVIRFHEGLVLEVARDVDDSCFIGYGLNLDVHPGILEEVLGYTEEEARLVVTKNKQINEQEAEMLLIRKTTELWEELDSKLKNFDNLSPRAQAALISMAYNCPRLVGPRMTKFVDSQQHINAAIEAAYGNKFVKELPGLQKRRIAEALLYYRGQYPKAKEAQLPPAESEEEHAKFYELALQMAAEGQSLPVIGERLTDES